MGLVQRHENPNDTVLTPAASVLSRFISGFFNDRGFVFRRERERESFDFRLVESLPILNYSPRKTGTVTGVWHSSIFRGRFRTIAKKSGRDLQL